MNINDLIRLVEQAQKGDRNAFGQLYQYYAPKLERVALRITRSWAQAGDLLQDAFIQAMKKIGQLRKASRFEYWLKKIIRRLGTNQLNRCKKQAQSTDPKMLSTRPDSRRCDPESIMTGELQDKVRSVLNTMPQSDRDVLVIHYMRGQSIKDISSAWNIPEGTVKRRLFDARNRLRDRLEQDGCFGPDLAF